jgi:hypothetical protein
VCVHECVDNPVTVKAAEVLHARSKGGYLTWVNFVLGSTNNVVVCVNNAANAFVPVHTCRSMFLQTLQKTLPTHTLSIPCIRKKSMFPPAFPKTLQKPSEKHKVSGSSVLL